MNSKCKICSYSLFKKPILVLKKIPKAAQFFPRRKEFIKDHGIKLSIYQCKKCGTVQLKSKPVSYYKSVITATSFSRKTEKFRLHQIKKFINENNLLNSKILEVGCGKGDMLNVFDRVGLKSYGLEWNTKSAIEGKKKGRKIIKGFIEDKETIPGHPFDIFVCYNFLEHLPNPNKALQNIYKNIKENALGVITVPNFNYLLKTRCFYEFVPDHLLYFQKKNIKYLLEKNSFKIIECSTINNDNDIQLIVKKITKARIKNLNYRFNKLNLRHAYREVKVLINKVKKIVKQYKSQNKKISVWGAGHRTLTFLSLANLKDIEFVVDSAKFKQGKYIPILHKKILSPLHLKKERIDLLFIMVPGIYPEEVANLAKKMKLGIDIIIMKDNKLIKLN